MTDRVNGSSTEPVWTDDDEAFAGRIAIEYRLDHDVAKSYVMGFRDGMAETEPPAERDPRWLIGALLGSTAMLALIILGAWKLVELVTPG